MWCFPCEISLVHIPAPPYIKVSMKRRLRRLFLPSVNVLTCHIALRNIVSLPRALCFHIWRVCDHISQYIFCAQYRPYGDLTLQMITTHPHPILCSVQQPTWPQCNLITCILSCLFFLYIVLIPYALFLTHSNIGVYLYFVDACERTCACDWLIFSSLSPAWFPPSSFLFSPIQMRNASATSLISVTDFTQMCLSMNVLLHVVKGDISWKSGFFLLYWYKSVQCIQVLQVNTKALWKIYFFLHHHVF